MKNAVIVLTSMLLLSCGDPAVRLPEIGIQEEFGYSRHEFHHEPEKVRGTLLSFVYDVSYFGACGVFPPRHIVGQIFASGGGDGGMSPGASWQPFRISGDTYQQLLELVRVTDPATLKKQSRYYHIRFIEDHAFDSIQDRIEWAMAVCEKHRDWYHAQQARISGQ